MSTRAQAAGAAALVALAKASIAHADPSWTAVAAPKLSVQETERAHRLKAGRVAVVSRAGAMVTGQFYDPVANTWTLIAPSSLPQPSAVASLPSGRLFGVAGTKTAFAFDAGTNTWSSLPSSTTSRSTLVSARLGTGLVLVVGGGVPERFDETTNSWSAAASLPAGHDPNAASELVLLTSGLLFVSTSGPSGLDRVHATYDPASNSWTVVPATAAPHTDAAWVALPDGRLMVVGGAGPSSVAEIYDPKTNAWSAVASLITPRTNLTATLLPTGRVMALGGGATISSGTLSTSEIYDPTTNTWSNGAAMATARQRHVAILLDDGRLLAVGGADSSSTALLSAEVYAPVAAGGPCTKAEDCATLVCSAGKCTDTCAIDGECPATAYCVAGKCVPRRSDGLSCKASSECASTYCAGGLCCDKTCFPYACDAKTCRSDCDLPGQCAPGYGCSTGKCVPKANVCSADRSASIDAAEKSTPCAPVLCDPTKGFCGELCKSDLDCITGTRCDSAGKCLVAEPTADSGGCALPGLSRGRSLAVWLAVLALVVRRARLRTSAQAVRR